MKTRLAIVTLFIAGAVCAQVPNSTLPSPRLNSLHPCGGQVGTTFEVLVRGIDLDDATSLRFTHKGITAELVKPAEPAKDAPKGDRRNPPPTLVKFKVTIAKDVPAGTHEVRFVGRHGVSNPRAFVVGQRPEVNEVEPNSDVPQAQRVEFGGVVNGVIDAQTDVDYFLFKGNKGQRVLIHCAAWSIDSRARPMVEVYAGDGRTRLGFNHDHDGTDALCDVTLPGDGDYFIRLTEFAYTAGGSDYFYRLTVGMHDWVEALFPPMIEPEKTMELDTLLRAPGNGNRQPTGQMKAPPLNFGMKGLALFPQAFGLADGFLLELDPHNPRPLLFATAPVIREDEVNLDNLPHKVVKTPCEIAGRIAKRNERDHYRFSAKKNESLMIELFAERIGTRMDGVLSLRDSTGREIANEQQLDDDPEALHPLAFFNRTTDPPPYRFVPPADGEYTVTVRSRDGNANYGPRTIYRLRIAPPKPDFRAVVMPRHREAPSGVTVRPGGEVALDIFAERRDGFAGPITFTASGLPKGVSAKPAVIGTNQKWGLLVLSGADNLTSAEAEIAVTATATIDGKEVTRPVRSANITWNVPNANNTPTIARLDRGLVIAARPGEKQPLRLTAKPDKATIRGSDNKERPAGDTLAVKPGEKILLPVSVAWQGDGARPNVVNLATEPTFSTQGAGAVMANNGQPIPVAKDKAEATLTLDVRPNIAPGIYNVLLRADTRAPMISDPMTKAKKDYVLMAFAQPLTVKVLPTSLGRLTASVAGPVKPGKTTTLLVRVERQFDFAGEFPITVTFPPNSGLSAEAATIPGNAGEVRVTITAASDAKPGNVPNVAVESSPTFDGDAVPHKTQVNVTIAK